MAGVAGSNGGSKQLSDAASDVDEQLKDLDEGLDESEGNKATHQLAFLSRRLGRRERQPLLEPDCSRRINKEVVGGDEGLSSWADRVMGGSEGGAGHEAPPLFADSADACGDVQPIITPRELCIV